MTNSDSMNEMFGVVAQQEGRETHDEQKSCK